MKKVIPLVLIILTLFVGCSDNDKKVSSENKVTSSMSEELSSEEISSEHNDEDYVQKPVIIKLLDSEANPLSNVLAGIEKAEPKKTDNEGVWLTTPLDLYKYKDPLPNGQCPINITRIHPDGTRETHNLTFEYNRKEINYVVQTGIKSIEDEFKSAKPRVEVTVVDSGNKPVENMCVEWSELPKSVPQIDETEEISETEIEYRKTYTNNEGKVYFAFEKGKLKKGPYCIYVDEYGMRKHINFKRHDIYIKDTQGVTKFTIKLE